MIGLALAVGVFGGALSAYAACSNPSPLPSGYAAPCPVFAVSPASLPQTGTLTLNASPQPGTDYIYTTAYYAQGSTWTAVTLTGNNAAPSYSSGPASGALNASSLSSLPIGTNYVVLWDWLWDSSAQCYKGPGLNQCNTGTWRLQTFGLTTAPTLPGQTIFTTQTHGFINVNNGVNYEMGTRFSSNIAGKVTAIRFWKDSNESGIHVGRLWDASGNLLTSVTFANETASGWQQESLAPPFAIAANTTYTVSANTTNTSFVYSLIGTATPVVNGNLQTIVGNYGAQVSGAPGTYPASASQNNLFRDIVFVPGAVVSPIPTPTPTPTPTPNPTGCTGPLNILNPPPVGCRPYPSAYFNKKLPNAGAGGPLNHLMPGSDAIVNTVMHNSGSLITDSALWHTPGSDDFSSTPFYYGQASDPVYQISGCQWGGTFINGMKFHGPSGAQYNSFTGGSSDGNIVIRDQTSHMVFQFYTFGAGSLPACSGGASSPCNFTHDGNGYCSAQNEVTGPGIQAGSLNSIGLPGVANFIGIKELKDVHHLNHGIPLYTWCNGTGNGLYPNRTVFPVGNGSGGTALTCPSAGLSDTNRPPNGALFYLDYTQAQLDCFDPTKAACGGINKMTVLQFALIEAMTLYGGTIQGTGIATGIGMSQVESEQAYQFYETHGYPGAQAIADSFTAFMDANCTAPTCIRVTRSAPHSLVQWNLLQWNLSDWAGISLVNDTDVASHMHVADPCVAKALQGVAGGCP